MRAGAGGARAGSSMSSGVRNLGSNAKCFHTQAARPWTNHPVILGHSFCTLIPIEIITILYDVLYTIYNIYITYKFIFAYVYSWPSVATYAESVGMEAD